MVLPLSAFTTLAVQGVAISLLARVMQGDEERLLVEFLTGLSARSRVSC